MTKSNPYGRYIVCSHHHYHETYPDILAAGRYDKLSDAIEHAESVTYKMVVLDSQAESRGFVYKNWDVLPMSTPWGQVQDSEELAKGIWRVETSSHGGIWLADWRLKQLTEILGYEYPTFCGSPMWFEEDCDWAVVSAAFGAEIAANRYEAACKQLRGMANWPDNDRYKRAYEALVASGRILDTEKAKQAVASRSPFPVHCGQGGIEVDISDAAPGL